MYTVQEYRYEFSQLLQTKPTEKCTTFSLHMHYLKVKKMSKMAKKILN